MTESPPTAHMLTLKTNYSAIADAKSMNTAFGPTRREIYSVTLNATLHFPYLTT